MSKRILGFKDYFNVLFLLMICLSILLFSEPAVKLLKETTADKYVEKPVKYTVAIDPGHGGWDPGKVGVTGVLEKDINLQIALKLKVFLEKNDINVLMTRDSDVGLHTEGASSKKSSDMRNRVDTINNSDAIIAVSIHQNSFTQESIKGAQVFYYTMSDDGKDFAEIMQNKLKETIADGNKRQAKSNDSYYMLKKTNCPLVIVECGYLSNYAESKLLVEDEYQEKVAWAIHLGILEYVNAKMQVKPVIAER